MDKAIILKKFRSKKVLTIEDLTVLLARSIRTARRFVKEHQIMTSINKNARFYTLPDIPIFDRNGIWQYQDIFFSQYGNLKQTILHLILDSESGLTAIEVGRMVGLADNSPFMSTLKKIDTIKKEEFGKRGYIYYAHELEIYQRQKKLRMAIMARMTSLPSFRYRCCCDSNRIDQTS